MIMPPREGLTPEQTAIRERAFDLAAEAFARALIGIREREQLALLKARAEKDEQAA